MTINALNLLPIKTASCDAMGNAAHLKRMNVSWANKKVGDVVQYDFNHNGTSDHTGILESINSDGSINVIEGNTSEKSNDNGGNVMRRRRTKSQTNYFIRPAYNEKVTPEMVLATARAELGTKESPANSNNVKYNTWYYGRKVSGSAYPWCEVFVCWIFAHIKGEEKPIPKPTGKYDGEIPQGTFKLGSKGNAVKQLQSFLNWYGANCGTVDGEFGSNTDEGVCAFQRAEDLTVDGIFGKNSYAKAITYKEVKKQKYTGAFPDFVAHSRNYLEQVAKNLAYEKGTSAKKYNYKTGKAKEAFTKAIKKVYGSSYSKWSKQCRLGASCDVYVGTVLRYSGCDTTWARGLDTQVKKTPKNMKQVTDLKAGDMLYYLNKSGGGHTRMIVDVNGTLYNCEANHNKNGGQYSHIGSKASKPTGKKLLKIFRVNTAFRPFIAKGDDGSEVVKLQKFLAWAGYTCGSADGDFGDKTYKAVVDFQNNNGLKADGEFGTTSLTKAKALKR